MALRTLVLASALASTGEAAKATPIEKVITLLKGLQDKVAAEGKKEAAAYDKYACFCKEQADGKLYSIEKSKKKIGHLSAEIDELSAFIGKTDGEISELSKKISNLDKEIEDGQKKRDEEHAKYQAAAADMQEAIDATAAAVAAIKESKGNLKDAKLNLVQVRSKLLATASRQSVQSQNLEKLMQEPAKYTFQGNDVIALLEDLLRDFKDRQARQDQDEFDQKSIFDKTDLGLKNERKFAEKERDEKSADSADATERNNAAKEDRKQEDKDMNSDQSFLDVLTKDCEDKATLFDKRSKTRSDEMQAMAQAMEALQEGVKPNEGANKKLVGLYQRPSFLQIRTLQQGADNAVRRVQSLLQEAAEQQNSRVLKNVAVRVGLSADHFVKVRGLIKDLIAKLKDDAKAEAEQKSFCDKEMNKALSKRDEAQGKKETAEANIAQLKSEVEKLTNEIEDLSNSIAAAKKALKEASELRAEEKQENEETIASAEDGKKATETAMGVLKDFYSNAFVQTSSKYTPPNADREGNTVGDVAPETFSDDYHGAQSESKGIIGILEVIASDFERTINTVNDDEKDAQNKFNEFEKSNLDNTKTDQDSVDAKEKRRTDAKDEMVEQQNNLGDATKIHEAANDELDKLKEMCVDGEETWEERAAARKKEIEALKEAQQILDEWQN